MPSLRQPPRSPRALELVEEVYFSLLDEHDGTLTVSAYTASLGLAAAVVTDLVDTEYLFMEANVGTVHARAKVAAPPASALAHTVWEAIVEQPVVLTVPDWLRYWAVDDFITAVAARMVRRELLVRIERRRRFGRDGVALEPVDRSRAAWPLVRLRQRLTQPHQERPTPADLRLFAILTALDLTDRLGDAATATNIAQAQTHLPEPLRVLSHHLRATVGATAMTGST